MAKNKFSLPDVKKLNTELAKAIAPEVNKLFRESVGWAIYDWYDSYDPKMYKRTNNFLGIIDTAKTVSSGDILTMSVDASSMHDYPGFEYPPYECYVRESLLADYAFDFMFLNGEHGHGRWMMKQSMPPFQCVDQDVFDEFGGRVQGIINKKIPEILFKGR